MAKDTTEKPPVLIVTGDIQQGKTTLLESIIQDLKGQDIQPYGFFSEAERMGNEAQGYRLVSISDNKARTLCSIFPKRDSVRCGRFYFDPEALEFGIELLNNAAKANAGLIVIDEIGPLELDGQGWAPAMDNLCNDSAIPMVWVVRRSMVEKAVRKWDVGRVSVIDITEKHAKVLIGSLIRKMTMARPKREVAPS